MLADLEQLVRCESPSHDLAAVASSAALVAELGARYLGQPAETIVLDGRSHLRWTFSGTGPRVLLVGHHDTVWPVGSLQTHPWRVEDGPTGRLVRGPGCFDMKAGLVQLFHAIALLADRHSITVLITGDEEIGSPTSRSLIEAEARLAGAALILEPSGDGGALKTERKGIALYQVAIRGLAAHAGLEPERGINASVELAAQVLHIAGLGDPAVGTTVTPTAMSAGTTSNTVPASGHLMVDVRGAEVEELHRVDASMHSLRQTVSGTEVSTTGGVNRPPLARSRSAALFGMASRLSAELGLGRLAECAVGGGSDGNFTAGVGTPTLDGLGAVGGGAHADHEHLLVDQLPSRTLLLVALLDELRGAQMSITQ
ncbi:MAG: M20 family metallopeptidase [Actinomycetota bacterium]|nr:M20 family metallopeptidase [Actinomycetota bacterium]